MIFLVSAKTYGKKTLARLLDTESKTARDAIVEDNLIQLKRLKIENAEVNDYGKLVGTTGSIEKCIDKPMAVILNSMTSGDEIIGYTIATYEGKILNVRLSDMGKIFKMYCVQNASVVDRKFIRGINWEIPSISFDNKIKEPDTKTENARTETAANTNVVTESNIQSTEITSKISNKVPYRVNEAENEIKGIIGDAEDLFNRHAHYIYKVSMHEGENITTWKKIDNNKFVKFTPGYEIVAMQTDDKLKAENVDEFYNNIYIDSNGIHNYLGNNSKAYYNVSDELLSIYGESIAEKIKKESNKIKKSNKKIKTYTDTGLAVPNKTYKYTDINLKDLNKSGPCTKENVRDLIKQSNQQVYCKSDTKKIVCGPTSSKMKAFYVFQINNSGLPDIGIATFRDIYNSASSYENVAIEKDSIMIYAINEDIQIPLDVAKKYFLK